ncbi:tryptophan halogenase family protein [Gilvimarinus chinensis]|uniref:tryptophan halogenase family protein n=1 Tax=Gilvimarinus chinensis TaxID=396005 RepID=UPI00037189A0|nr:tryptophan halogenase family protein [Gilvimarinus chinensis]
MINNSLNGLNLIIVGGGTAGWMAANLIKHHCPDAEVTLIESDKVAPIGVGEGSTPYLKQFFNTLGVEDSVWMPECDATYKAGIRFPGWSEVSGFESYFHPFFSELDIPTAEPFFEFSKKALRGVGQPVHPDDYFVNQPLAALGLAPVAKDPSLNIDYGYHFDAVKLGQFLKRNAQNLGVKCVIDHVDKVFLNDKDGAIKALQTRTSGLMRANMFVDCTGFSGLLSQQTYALTFKSYADYLFNDRAVTVMTKADSTLQAQTTSTALKNGWAWKIPLQSRTGNGYVYSSKYCSNDQAEHELLSFLGAEKQGANVRHLSMKVGRLSEHWHKNCLSVGLSQGFIEPLEATALMLVQYTVDTFIRSFDSAKPVLENNQQQVNDKVNCLTDGVLDYICAHYRMNSRSDTAYWRDCRDAPVPPTLAILIEAWRKGEDFDAVLQHQHNELAYLRPSWYVLLAGMGCFKSSNCHRQFDQIAAAKCKAKAQHAFPDQRTLLKAYSERVKAKAKS